MARSQRRRRPRPIASAALDDARQVRARRLNRRYETEDERARHRHGQAEEERAPIHVKRDHDRQIARNPDLTEQHHPGVADGEPERAAGDGKDEILGHELANQPAAASADGEPQCHLPRPDRCPARQQSGYVAAGDQQHRRRERREHRHQHRLGRALGNARLELGLHEELPVLVRLGIGALEVAGNRGQLALRLRLRNARLQPSFQRQIPHVARLERCSLRIGDDARRHHQRDEEIVADVAVHAGKARRRHADDGERHAVDADGAAQHTAVGPELLLPHRPSEDDHGVTARHLILFRYERAADGRLHAHQRQQVADDQQPDLELRRRRRIGREARSERGEGGQTRCSNCGVTSRFKNSMAATV